MIIGLCGLAGSGKDTAADFLVERMGFAKISFADPMKRFCREVFAFTDEQLWGPSSARNAPDPRYPRRPYGSPNAPVEHLTPRYALQRLGTEFGRDCYEPIWVDVALRTAKTLEEWGTARYSSRQGLYFEDSRDSSSWDSEPTGSVIPDVRFRNELDAVRAAGGKVFRIVRPGSGLSGEAALHASEREQAEIPDEDFDEVIQNVGTLDDLRAAITRAAMRHGALGTAG